MPWRSILHASWVYCVVLFCMYLCIADSRRAHMAWLSWLSGIHFSLRRDWEYWESEEPIQCKLWALRATPRPTPLAPPRPLLPRGPLAATPCAPFVGHMAMVWPIPPHCGLLVSGRTKAKSIIIIKKTEQIADKNIVTRCSEAWNTIQNHALQYNAIQYNAIQNNTIQYHAW